jgi:hypothetical protein
MSTDAPDDPLLRSLAELPELGPDRLRKERTLRRARARFIDEHAAGGSAASRRARHLYADFVTPTMLAGGAAVYLLWALRFCTALYMG